MITHKQLAAAIGLFGLVVIGSGLVRYLTDTAGQNRTLLWPLCGRHGRYPGAVLAIFHLSLVGRIVAGLAIALVLLWFSYDMYKDLSGTSSSAAEKCGRRS